MTEMKKFAIAFEPLHSGLPAQGGHFSVMPEAKSVDGVLAVEVFVGLSVTSWRVDGDGLFEQVTTLLPNGEWSFGNPIIVEASSAEDAARNWRQGIEKRIAL